jgi:hypothetical protein
VAIALKLADQKQLSQDLHQALTSRTVIGQAGRSSWANSVATPPPPLAGVTESQAEVP